MKKILTLIAGFVLVCIALAIIGPIILVGVGAAITYYSVKSFIKTPSLFGKLCWVIVGITGVSIIFRSIPALVGVAAVALLYYGYRQWKSKKKAYKASSGDPDYTTDFKDFESDWKSIMSKHS